MRQCPQGKDQTQLASLCGSAYARLDLEALMLKGIHPSASDRLWTVSERIGATAALLVVISFGLFAIAEPVWRIARKAID